MNDLIVNSDYQQLKAQTFEAIRGFEPGKYFGDCLKIEIEKIEHHYQVKVRFGFYNWLFFYPATQFEIN